VRPTKIDEDGHEVEPGTASRLNRVPDEVRPTKIDEDGHEVEPGTASRLKTWFNLDKFQVRPLGTWLAPGFNQVPGGAVIATRKFPDPA
jgi:hypothetical protein